MSTSSPPVGPELRHRQHVHDHEYSLGVLGAADEYVIVADWDGSWTSGQMVHANLGMLRFAGYTTAEIRDQYIEMLAPGHWEHILGRAGEAAAAHVFVFASVAASRVGQLDIVGGRGARADDGVSAGNRVGSIFVP